MRAAIAFALVAALACGTASSSTSSGSGGSSADGGSGNSGDGGSGSGSSGGGSGTTDGGTGGGGSGATMHHVMVAVRGSGFVQSSPAGIACPALCEADFADGTQVTLTAAPGQGFVLTGFTGACTGNSCALTLSADAAVQVAFTPAPITLHVSVSGSGTVVSTPPGISCPGQCSAQFAQGTNVSLTATPAAGSTFSGFGGDCSGTACTNPWTRDANVTASFAIIEHVLDVSLSGDGAGRVTSQPAGIDCPGTCSASFPEGANVTLTATPDLLSKLTQWSGSCTGAPCAIALHADGAVDATFALRRYKVVDLGTLNADSFAGASAISPHDLLVAGNSGYEEEVFFWNGNPQHTGIRGGATGINDAGTIAGYTLGSANMMHAFMRTSDGVFLDLSTPNESQSTAEGINKDGVVVGWVSSASFAAHAEYWHNGAFVDLGSLGQCSYAYGINDGGIIVGESCIENEPVSHAVRFRNPGVIDDLGVIGGTFSSARAINASGLIVGMSTVTANSSLYHAAIWQNGTIIDGGVVPGTVMSQLSAVNGAGVAVGVASDGQSDVRGIVWGSGRLFDLNTLVTSPIKIIFASGVDESGNIAGQGLVNGSARAILLQPQ